MNGVSHELDALLSSPMEPNSSVRALNALASAGLYTVEQVKAADLSRVNNLGPVLAEFIMQRIAPTWRCFFCDEVFRREQDATEHFGAGPGDRVICQIKAHEGPLVEVIRDQQRRLAAFADDRDGVMRSLMALESGHTQELRTAEETGYGRGVRDMQALALKQFGKEVVLFTSGPFATEDFGVASSFDEAVRNAVLGRRVVSDLSPSSRAPLGERGESA